MPTATRASRRATSTPPRASCRTGCGASTASTRTRSSWARATSSIRPSSRTRSPRIASPSCCCSTPLRDCPEPAQRLAAQRLDDRLHHGLGLVAPPVRDRADDAALAREYGRHVLVDRLGGEQVPRGHGVALADPVRAVLGLVVHRRAPLEIEERDVGGARERDALTADARGAH